MSSNVPPDDRIGLKHGAGGRAMRRLIEEAFMKAFHPEPEIPAGLIGLSAMDDGAAIRIGDQWLVTEGLADGDRLIVEGLQSVRPGMAVEAIESAGAGASNKNICAAFSYSASTPKSASSRKAKAFITGMAKRSRICIATSSRRALTSK